MRIDKTNQQAALPHIRKSNAEPSVSNGAEKTTRDAKTAPPSLPNIRTSNAVPVVSNGENVDQAQPSTKPVVSNVDSSMQYIREMIAGQSEARDQFLQVIKLRLNSGELTSPQAAYDTAKSILDE